jgi:hypothetical protein
MDPITLAVLGAPAIGSLIGGWLSGRRNNTTQQNPQLMPNNLGYQTQEIPGGTTALRMNQFNPQQQNALAQLLSQGLGGLQNLPSASFAPIKESALSDFYQNIVPGIAERFTGIGSGSQRSSAFEQALGSAGSNLSQKLAAMEQGFNQQQQGMDQQRLLALLQAGLTPQYQTQFIEPQQSTLGGLGAGLAQGAGSIIPLLLSKYLG